MHFSLSQNYFRTILDSNIKFREAVYDRCYVTMELPHWMLPISCPMDADWK